jgi:hypothetical protein
LTEKKEKREEEKKDNRKKIRDTVNRTQATGCRMQKTR